MPLTRGVAIGYDVPGMTFKFSMVDDKIRVVECDVSGAAMDQLTGSKGTLPKDRHQQFALLRDRIEEIASGLFDLDTTRPAAVHIFYHHVRGPKGR